jgi:hypothetical protein
MGLLTYYIVALTIGLRTYYGRLALTIGGYDVLTMREAARKAPKVKKPSERGSTALSRCSMRSRSTCV